MISSKLSARLERLESRLTPAGEPKVLQVVYITPDGRSEDGPRYTIPASPNGTKWGDSWRWKRNRDSYR
jgi:hypothetical protein